MNFWKLYFSILSSMQKHKEERNKMSYPPWLGPVSGARTPSHRKEPCSWTEGSWAPSLVSSVHQLLWASCFLIFKTKIFNLYSQNHYENRSHLILHLFNRIEEWEIIKKSKSHAANLSCFRVIFNIPVLSIMPYRQDEQVSSPFYWGGRGKTLTRTFFDISQL